MRLSDGSVEPSVALVFSPEMWVEELHRHLSHHGGARVRHIVVEPSVALDEEYDVLVVSDRWPALTFGFVGAVHARGRSILGVFDPEEPAGKDHLVDLGVDATIAADAQVTEFVVMLRDLDTESAIASPLVGGKTHRVPTRDDEPSGTVVAVSGARGSGVTEVALGIATTVADHRRSVLLLDAHEAAPALAGRLGLGLEPNLRTAVDACAHGLGALDDCVVAVVDRGAVQLGAIAGHPSAIAASQVSTQDVLDVVAAARHEHDFVIVDLEERTPTARAVTGVADAVVGVVHASPVGVVRGLEWTVDAVRRGTTAPLHLVVNHAPRSRFRQEEIRAEIERTIRPTSLGWYPHDRAVEAAAWDGVPVARGGFRAACTRTGEVLDPVSGRHGRRWSR
jgi:MinD-like ATPase involved in chromosome partitioning or flagellar assembly